MPTLKLTQLAVDRLKPPGSGRVEYWDSQLPGFGLRVSETGRKTWIALYRVSGKLVRETIGTAALIPKVDEARERARASLLLARGGKNPVAEREERAETERRALDADRTRARNSLGVVLDRYLAERAKLRLRPSTFAEVERALAVDVKQALGGAGMPPLGG
ncbi:MAG TPA: Arm DNA-binding domain-containing protein, partial [Stellaceae bacterium]|nr:Arm DNA-binding domain-containing protein [Stellaceae bacterium]